MWPHDGNSSTLRRTSPSKQVSANICVRIFRFGCRDIKGIYYQDYNQFPPKVTAAYKLLYTLSLKESKKDKCFYLFIYLFILTIQAASPVSLVSYKTEVFKVYALA